MSLLSPLSLDFMILCDDDFLKNNFNYLCTNLIGELWGLNEQSWSLSTYSVPTPMLTHLRTTNVKCAIKPAQKSYHISPVCLPSTLQNVCPDLFPQSIYTSRKFLVQITGSPISGSLGNTKIPRNTTQSKAVSGLVSSAAQWCLSVAPSSVWAFSFCWLPSGS